MMRLDRHGPVFVATLDRNENVNDPALALRSNAILDEGPPAMIEQHLCRDVLKALEA